jgi:hypothetical protein
MLRKTAHEIANCQLYLVSVKLIYPLYGLTDD